MTEIVARIAAEDAVELVKLDSSLIASISMTHAEAAYLARDLLASAAALSSPIKPKVGAMVADAHIPFAGKLGWSNINGNPVLSISVPPGVDLTFEMTREVAKQLGAALTAHAEQKSPLGDHPSTVH